MQLGLSAVVLVALALQCRRLCPNVSWSVTLRPKAMREPGAYFGWSVLHAVANILKFEGVDKDGYPTFSTPEAVSGNTQIWQYNTGIGQCWYASIGLKYMFN